MYAKLLFFLTAIFCAFISKAQKQQLSFNEHTHHYESKLLFAQQEVWDSLEVAFLSPPQTMQKIGFYLNYVDVSNHHFLNLAQLDEQLVFTLGKIDSGNIRQAEQTIHKASVEPNKLYRLTIYRAPWVDQEHWSPWKIDLVDIASGSVLLKASLENNMPFFGMGTVVFLPINEI